MKKLGKYGSTGLALLLAISVTFHILLLSQQGMSSKKAIQAPRSQEYKSKSFVQDSKVDTPPEVEAVVPKETTLDADKKVYSVGYWNLHIMDRDKGLQAPYPSYIEDRELTDTMRDSFIELFCQAPDSMQDYDDAYFSVSYLSDTLFPLT